MFLSKFLGKNPLNFVQLAAPKFVRKFVRFFRENLRIKILRTFSEDLMIGPSPGQKFVRKFVRFFRENWKNQIFKTFFESLLIGSIFREKI